MIYYASRILFPALLATAAFAQTMDIYSDTSSDGTNVYVSGVLQYTAAPDCSMCTVATHTYSGTVTVTSPSGRVGSCGFGTSESAEDAQNLQCDASLPIDGEVGDYTGTYNPSVACSMFGTLLNITLSGKSYIGTSETTWAYLTGMGTQVCSYTKISTCPPQSCGSATDEGLSNYGTCTSYIVADFVYLYKSGIRYCFPIGIGEETNVKGGCN